MTSEIEALLRRHDPKQWRRTLAYRKKTELPYDPSAVAVDASILLDTTVYLDNLAGKLPAAISELMATRPNFHASPAIAELALPIGFLDPEDARTSATLAPILTTLIHIPPDRMIAPSPENWLEGAVIAAILARTQAIAKTDRRRFMNDVLIYLIAGTRGTTVVTRNSRDFDLLMQIKPGVGVLLYDRA